MIIIVGLGNPGKKYEKTRHNLGFVIIDKFLKRNDFPNWEKSKKINCLYAKKNVAGKEIELVEPLAYMNNSGEVVRSIAKKHNLKGENILVVHDDIDLTRGKIKIIKNRGSAGHKGVQSIIDELGSKNFVRFRIGIKPVASDKRQTTKLEKIVLQKFNKEEEKILKEVIERTCQAIEMTIKEGAEKAMNEFNQ
jgi:PTH1 family peptidyl-tRNA hydrolase